MALLLLDPHVHLLAGNAHLRIYEEQQLRVPRGLPPPVRNPGLPGVEHHALRAHRIAHRLRHASFALCETSLVGECETCAVPPRAVRREPEDVWLVPAYDFSAKQEVPLLLDRPQLDQLWRVQSQHPQGHWKDVRAILACHAWGGPEIKLRAFRATDPAPARPSRSLLDQIRLLVTPDAWRVELAPPYHLAPSYF